MSKKIEKKLPAPAALRRLRLLILDVDGVMTDGTITYDSSGGELKSFNVKDGAGLDLWRRAGLRAGIITGRSSPMVARRAKELGFSFLEMGVTEKLPAFERMLAAAGLSAAETVAMGDDVYDLPILRRAGLGVAVADAVPEAREAADLVSSCPGGRGAVRETVELILKAQGRWKKLMGEFA